MGLFNCPPDELIWDGIDVGTCFKSRIINTLLPLVLVSLSLLLLLSTSLVAAITSHFSPPPIQLPTVDFSPPLPSNAAISPVELENTVIRDSALAIFGEDEEEGPSTLETLSGWTVFLLQLVLLGVEVARGVRTPELTEGWGGVGFSAFLAVLSGLEVGEFGEKVFGLEGGDVSAHRITLLTVYFFTTLVTFRSTLISHEQGDLIMDPLASSLVLAILLLDITTPYRSSLDGVLAGRKARGSAFHRRNTKASSSIGANEALSSSFRTTTESGEKIKVVKPPSIEEPLSLTSRSLFSYLQPLIWKHYWTPIEEKDVPELREDDRTSVVVGGWREFRERERRGLKHPEGDKLPEGKGSLSWKLLVYFKGYFALQTFWSMVFVFASYLAPLTLKLILEFIAYRKLSIADPEEFPPQPNHLAFSYVALMFFGQVVSSVSHGYALWLGRRICVRLRSIIITEVFTKALRRTDSARATKALTPPGALDPLKAAADLINAEQDQSTKKDEEAKAPDAAEDEASIGKVLNLVSVDAFSVSEIAAYLLYIFPECPLSICLAIYFLWRLLGVSALVGVATLVALLPLQFYFAKLFVTVQKELLVATDARLDLATEVLAAIRLVKFNSWESRFFDKMKKTRKTELKLLSRRFVVWTLQGVLSWGTPALVTVVTFGVHTKFFNAPLPTETAFTALALFGMLRSPLETMTDMIAHVLAAHVSCTRVEDFLAQPETSKYSNLTLSSSVGEPTIGFKNASLSYASPEELAKDESLFTLKNLNLDFPEGELSIIAGSVGSGKTTLLLSLLGETSLHSGTIFMHEHFSRNASPLDPVTGFSRTVAYAGQQPWLVGASIRQNIVFGSPWDAKRYAACLTACQLERDLEILELGDETEVGEKGTALSGGQKARVALARAVYSRSSTILLDDVLSAVDAHTARFLFQNCLKGPLLAGRTVIIVTHAVGLVLPGAAYGVVLDNGSVLAAGSPDELKAASVFSDDALADSGADDEHVVKVDSKEVAKGTLEEVGAEAGDADVDEAKKIQDKKDSKKLVKEETTTQGGVSLDVYKLYIGAMGTLVFWIILIALFFGSQSVQIAVNLWIRKWASQYDVVAELQNVNVLSFILAPLQLTSNASSGSSDFLASEAPTKDSTTYYLTVYVLISAAYMVTIAIRMSVLFYGSLRASQTIYEDLLKRILSARTRFFDSTPSGRILNRVSKDIAQIDQELSPVLMYLVTSILSSFAVLLVISFSTPWFIAAAAVIIVLYWLIGAAYLAISRQLKRIESVSRSPIYVCFAEVLNGMVTVRAYGESARFTSQCLDLIDDNNSPFLLLWGANRWLSIYCDVTGGLVGLFAAIFILLNPTLDAGIAGLSLSYAITFTDYVLWVVRLYSAMEINLNSVERIREYLVLESEEEEDAKGIEPPAAWPSRNGSIEVKSLTARYAPELDPVLKDVSFTVLPQEKVGICGRTGSGKSTLALTFFRFLEASGGSITIDGLDISKMSLHTLRSRLTIIPQEAQLFTGSIRDNLDPFQSFEDADIWEALVRVRMASWSTPAASRVHSRAPSRANSTSNLVALNGDATPVEGEMSQVTSLSDGVAAGGANWSAGQRQLLALARGLLKLKESNILILDESTANLDHATDAHIQQCLRELGEVTTLIVAHRLRTIVECDKILVLDAGQVVEFGPPLELLKKEGGSFRALCEKSGEMVVLQEMAEKAHAGRLGEKEKI